MTSLPDMTPNTFLEHAKTFEGAECLEWPFSKSGGGYGKVGRAGKTLDVHRLICRDVHGEPPGPKFEAAHSCGNRACCNPSHLRWDTRKGNFADKVEHGTLLRGDSHSMAKISSTEVAEIRSLKGKMLQREIGALFGIQQSQVARILNGARWSHV